MTVQHARDMMREQNRVQIWSDFIIIIIKKIDLLFFFNLQNFNEKKKDKIFMAISRDIWSRILQTS